jgi:D-aminopeptidase
MPHQLKRLARRVPMGIGRMGGLGTNGSGDIFIAFSTANQVAGDATGVAEIQSINGVAGPAFYRSAAESLLN